MRRPSIPFSAIPFPRARAERVEVLFSPAPELKSMLLLDPRDPPKEQPPVPADFEADDDFELEDEDDFDEEDEDEDEA